MEVDLGSALLLVSYSTIKRLVPRISKRWLKACSLRFRDYQGNGIPILGTYKFKEEFKDFVGQLQPCLTFWVLTGSSPWDLASVE